METKIEVVNAEAPTTIEEVLLQNNDIALNAIHDAVDERTVEALSKSRILRWLMRYGRSWRNHLRAHKR